MIYALGSTGAVPGRGGLGRFGDGRSLRLALREVRLFGGRGLLVASQQDRHRLIISNADTLRGVTHPDYSACTAISAIHRQFRLPIECATAQPCNGTSFGRITMNVLSGQNRPRNLLPRRPRSGKAKPSGTACAMPKRSGHSATMQTGDRVFIYHSMRSACDGGPRQGRLPLPARP